VVSSDGGVAGAAGQHAAEGGTYAGTGYAGTGYGGTGYGGTGYSGGVGGAAGYAGVGGCVIDDPACPCEGGAGGASGAGGEGGIGHGSCVSCDRIGDTWRMDSGSGGSGSIYLICHVSRGGCGEDGCGVLCVQPCDPFHDPTCPAGPGGAGGAGGDYGGAGGVGGGYEGGVGGGYVGGAGGGYHEYTGGVGGGPAQEDAGVQ
jgi:hypothetical protein